MCINPTGLDRRLAEMTSAQHLREHCVFYREAEGTVWSHHLRWLSVTNINESWRCFDKTYIRLSVTSALYNVRFPKFLKCCLVRTDTVAWSECVCEAVGATSHSVLNISCTVLININLLRSGRLECVPDKSAQISLATSCHNRSRGKWVEALISKTTLVTKSNFFRSVKIFYLILLSCYLLVNCLSLL
jgi:hypothetical protein